MHSSQIKSRDDQYVAGTYARFPVALVRGKGATCYDGEGRSYIDLTAGIGVNALGFCDPEWAEAVAKQAATLQHTSNLYYTEPCGAVAETLCHRTGARNVFFANSGAEANEGMIKCARKYSYEKYGGERNVIVTLVNSFHGRTVTTLAATGQETFHTNFFPFTDGFIYAKANDLTDTLQALSNKNVCALMMEMVQGEGGVIALDKEYVQAVEAYCLKNDILLLIDEVQTGIGRTGKLFSYQHYALQPDVVSCAKGIGGGLPMGAVLFFDKTKSVMGPGSHGSTFGGNPVCCAGANVVLSRLTEDFLFKVQQKSRYLFDRLSKMPHVTGVSGLGLMIGVSFTEDVIAKDVVAKCIDEGILPLTAKAKLRLLPPLSITMEELTKAMDVLQGVLEQF